MPKHPENNEISTIILDFDGVIADSFGIFVESLAEALKRPELTSDETEDLRGSSTRQIISKLGVKKWQMPSLITRGRKGIAARMDSVEVFKDMPEVISEAASEYDLFILSTNEKPAIAKLLGRYGIERSFKEIYSGTSVFGKARRLNALLKNENLSAINCVYVGDETRDVEAAHAIGMKCVAVSWGFSTQEALESYVPDALASEPSDLLSAIKIL